MKHILMTKFSNDEEQLTLPEMDRRQFGKLLVAGAGGLTMWSPLAGLASGPKATWLQSAKAFSGEHQVDVVIVGAGLSGLIAAKALRDAKKTVLVLEARERIGGRMYRQPIIKGGYVDMGGQWVGPTQLDMRALVDELKIEKFDSYEQGWSILSWENQRSGFDGNMDAVLQGRCNAPVHFPDTCKPEPVPPIVGVACDQHTPDSLAERVLWDKFIAITKTVRADKPWLSPQAKALDSITFQSWMDQETTLPYTQWPAAMWSRLGGSGGFEPNQVSLLHMAWTQVVGPQSEAPERWLLKGGAGQIPAMLAQKLGDVIVVSAAVNAIEHSDGGVTITTATATIKAGAVIVAIPPSMRAAIHFSPALPVSHSGLIQRAPMGSMSKVHAVYDTPFWREQCLSGSAAGNLAGNLPKSQSKLKTCEFVADSSLPPGTPSAQLPGILTSFIAGQRNIELSNASAADIQKAVIDDYVQYFGQLAANPKQFIHINWNAQNWTGGAFTGYMSPGVWTTFGAGLRDSVGKIFWAGTETSDRWPGYFDGAINAGKRAAKEVLGQS